MDYPIRSLSECAPLTKTTLSTNEELLSSSKTTYKCLSPLLSSTKLIFDCPLKKVTKSGTQENLMHMPSMKAITSKKDLYLTDKITIKIISSPHCQSSNDMQSLCINPDLIFDSNEIFMSESLKRPLYKLEMSEELNVRDIFNEENLFKFLSKTFMKNYLFYNIDKEGIEGILAYIFL